jgi:hypothetical protein
LAWAVQALVSEIAFGLGYVKRSELDVGNEANA